MWLASERKGGKGYPAQILHTHHVPKMNHNHPFYLQQVELALLLENGVTGTHLPTVHCAGRPLLEQRESAACGVLKPATCGGRPQEKLVQLPGLYFCQGVRTAHQETG